MLNVICAHPDVPSQRLKFTWMKMLFKTLRLEMFGTYT